jgi:asparagine synthase (glutamine-hydrolysing)
VGEIHGAGVPPDLLARLLSPGGSPAVELPAGSFAGIAADSVTQSLLFATDPFGIRPLFYWSDGDRVVCATRLSDLLHRGRVPASVDWLAVYHYLNFGYVPGPGTIYREVSLLPPGAVARAIAGKVEITQYWDMEYPGGADGDLAALATGLRTQIERAIRLAWPLDTAPGRVGCFLSGGTDSGTIAAIASTIDAPLKAFSIAFSEDSYDELAYAQLLAARFPLEHHVHRLSADDLLESIPLLTAESAQPFGNPSIVATWRCARLARESGSDLLLAGDGGDELFGGNERYAKDRVYALYGHLPARLRRGLATLARWLPGESLPLNRLRNVAYRGTLPNPERLYSDDALGSRYWDTLVVPELRRHVSRDASLALVRSHWDRVPAGHEIDRLMYVDLKTAIWGNDLVKVTTAARVGGVRVRFPFLDPELASFTGKLEPRMKVRGREKRWLFKRALADVLPSRVLHKPKHGFGVPVAEWIRTDRRVREAVLDPVLDSKSLVGESLTPAGLRQLVDEHLRGHWDHGAWLWALMMLARWHSVHGGGHAR